jgi:hypothetical protein
MMLVLLIAGIGSLVAGLLAIGFGIPVKEFSFGNTLILTGAVTACTGMVMLGLWLVVRELKNIARRLGPGVAAELEAGTALTSTGSNAESGFLFNRDQLASEDRLAEPAAPSSGSPPPWHEEVASRDRVRNDAGSEPEPPAEPAPAVKPRRNLLFSSSSKKERERAQARTADPAAVEPGPVPAAAPPAPEPSPPPSATFDDAWPKPEKPRVPEAPQRRGGRAPSTFTEASAGATTADRPLPAARIEEQPPVTVLKSGVVDGMAYSLYSDGSIEAQMPEGMMRFASIDELRSHLDHRP